MESVEIILGTCTLLPGDSEAPLFLLTEVVLEEVLWQKWEIHSRGTENQEASEFIWKAGGQQHSWEVEATDPGLLFYISLNTFSGGHKLSWLL